METDQKPGLPKFLQGLIDVGTGVFLQRADLENSRIELQIAAENRKADEAKAAAAQARQDAFNATASGLDLGEINPMFLVAGAAAIALILTLR